MERIYLKKQLSTNVPMTVRLKARKGAFPEKKYGTGELTGFNEYLYIFTDAQGRELTYYAKERDEEVLKDYQPGDSLTVVLQEKVNDAGKRYGFLVWGAAGSAEMREAAPIRTNTQEQTFQKRHDAYQSEQQDKDTRISLAGLMQAHIVAGRTNEQAIQLAISGKRLLDAAAISYSP